MTTAPGTFPGDSPRILEIIQRLAATPEPLDSFYGWCALCLAPAIGPLPQGTRATHKPDCPWILASDFVRET